MIVLLLACGSVVMVFVLRGTSYQHDALFLPTLGMSGCWVLWRLLALDATWQATRRSHQSPVWHLSPQEVCARSQAGLYLGQAFRWSASHTQALETILALQGRLPTATDRRGGYPVLHAVGESHDAPLTIPYDALAHMLIVGTTGSGKTQCLKTLSVGAIHGPGAVVIIDPNGDADWKACVHAEADRARKPFAPLTLAEPATSIRLNVLATARTPMEVSTRIRALMPPSKVPIFEEYPLALIEHIAAAQQALGEPWTLEGLYRPAVLQADLERLLIRYLTAHGFAGGRGRKQLVDHYRTKGPPDIVADALIEDVEHDRDHLAKVTASLMPTFQGFITPPYSALFSALPPDLTWRQMTEDSVVLYVSLASLLHETFARRVGRILLHDLLGFVGQRYAYEDVATVPPLTILADEIGRIACHGFGTALATTRRAQVRFLVAGQSLADLEVGIGSREEARVVLDNLSTRLYLRLADDGTAQDVSEGLGTCTVLLPEQGVGMSVGAHGRQGAQTRRLPGKQTPLFRHSWLEALPLGEGVLRFQGEVFKVRMPLLTEGGP